MAKSILLVFAHPDDESFGVAGTVAKYSQQGIPVDLVVATRGEEGSRIGVPPDMETGAVREAELAQAAAIMGIREIYQLGYRDGTLADIRLEEVARKVLHIMRRAEPQVVITFGPDGITGHADHIAVGKAATSAFQRYAPSAPEQPPRLYYVTVPDSALTIIGNGVNTRPEGQITTQIDISPYLDQKIKAIAAHGSQQDAVDFIRLLEGNRDSKFATREYLYLASDHANTPPEADLFE